MIKNLQFPYLTIRDVPLNGQTVLLRADYNVPLTSEGKIDNDYRITQSLPTLQYLIDKKCKIVICSHLGRPDGKPDIKLSLKPIAEHLAELLEQPVDFVDDCVGDKAYQGVKQATNRVVMLENLRFHLGEEADDESFAKDLARAAQAKYFVQDGFGVVHRAHASTSAITRLLPSVAGLLLEKEVTTINGAMSDPDKPMVVVMGGAKISDKIDLITKFVQIADKLLVGGAMANTFLQYYGLPMGKSTWEDGQQDEIQQIAELVDKKDGGIGACQHDGPRPCLLCATSFRLPVDEAVGHEVSPHAHRSTVPITRVGDDDYILDIGHQTMEMFKSELASAHTVIWNGTLGYAELPQFANGSDEIATALYHQHKTTETIIGGGDTADYVLKWNHGKTTGFGHISTGGGASLELMTGQKLPGVVALLKS